MLQEWQFYSFFFLRLELGREQKENDMMVGESKLGIELQDILIDYVLPWGCPLWGVWKRGLFWLFKGELS